VTIIDYQKPGHLARQTDTQMILEVYTVKNIFKICYHNIFSFVKSTL